MSHDTMVPIPQGCVTIVVRHVAAPYDGVLGVQRCARCGCDLRDYGDVLAAIRSPALALTFLSDPARARAQEKALLARIRPYAVGRAVTVLCTDNPAFPNFGAPTVDCAPVRAPAPRYVVGATTAYA